MAFLSSSPRNLQQRSVLRTPHDLRMHSVPADASRGDHHEYQNPTTYARLSMPIFHGNSLPEALQKLVDYLEMNDGMMQ